MVAPVLAPVPPLLEGVVAGGAFDIGKVNGVGEKVGPTVVLSAPEAKFSTLTPKMLFGLKTPATTKIRLNASLSIFRLIFTHREPKITHHFKYALAK